MFNVYEFIVSITNIFGRVHYLVTEVSGRPVMLIFKGIEVKEEYGERDGCD
jgi:hypothetical protein